MTAPLIIPEYQSNGQVTFGEQGFDGARTVGAELCLAAAAAEPSRRRGAGGDRARGSRLEQREEPEEPAGGREHSGELRTCAAA